MTNLRYKYNEKEFAEHILKNGFGSRFIKTELKTLVKYFKNQGKKPNEREKLIYSFCEQHIKNFNKVLYFKTINSSLSYGQRKDSQLIVIEHIDIYKSELKYIDELDLDIKYKKLLFTLLVFDKLNKEVQKIKYGKTDNTHFFGGDEKRYKELLEASHVSLGSKRRNDYKSIHDIIREEFVEKELVEIRNKGYINLLFIDKIDGCNEIEFNIKSYDDIGLYYEMYLGNEKIKKCECCGRLIKVRNNKNKFCRECAKKINIQKTIDNRKKRKCLK